MMSDETSPDVNADIMRTVQTLIGQVTRAGGTPADVDAAALVPVAHPGGGVADVARPGEPPQPATPNRTGAQPVRRSGLPESVGDVTSNARLQLKLIVESKTYWLQTAFPDYSTPKQYGFILTQASDPSKPTANDNVLVSFVVQNLSNWRLDLTPPGLPYTFDFATDPTTKAVTEGLTINTLAVSCGMGTVTPLKLTQ